ncbi:MAG TPA: hypothetical protein VHO84_13120, partial [Syntrophorhabdaceae bacterium]|nr:hypothetical protein [Syntrophorhabdaceae bacterium]
ISKYRLNSRKNSRAFFNYPVQQVKKSASRMPDMGIKTFFFSNVCSAIRKDVFQNMKGFPEGVIMNEDLLFAAKVIRDGQSIAYVPEAQVLHSHNYGFFRQFRRYFDIGVCFRDNKEALDGVTVGNEGMKFVIEEFRYLCTQRHFGWLPYSALELMCRYGGFVCGKSYTIFPAVVKKQMSLHRNYWDCRTSASRRT